MLRIIEESWQAHYVVFPITLSCELEVFRQKTYFMLVGVDGPITKRFDFYKKKHNKSRALIQDFSKLDDKINYGLDDYPSNVYECIYIADKVLLNLTDREALYLQLRALDVLNAEHIRPSWDTYFIRLSELAATRSNCMRQPIGTIIVKDHRIVATGYNGTPYGTTNCFEGGCERCLQTLREGEMGDLCTCLHAEANAMLFSGRSQTIGSTMYTSAFPCLTCSKTIIQSGLVRVVYHRSIENSENCLQMLLQSGIEVQQHSPVVPAPGQPEERDSHLSSISTPPYIKEFSKLTIK